MLDRAEKNQVIAALVSLAVYCAVAWLAAKTLGISFWSALGVLLAARLFFGLVEGLAGIINWRLFGKRQTIAGFLQVLRTNNFPLRYNREDHFLSYLARVEDDEKSSETLRRSAKDFERVLSLAEQQGVLAGMRMHAASEIALEAYSPRVNAPGRTGVEGGAGPLNYETRVTNPSIKPGTMARVTSGPSSGTVVRCIERVSAPPGTGAKSLPPPLWRVDCQLRWNDPNTGFEFECPAAPESALRAVESADTK